MDAILPSKRIGDFNQSIMELGARICLPVAKPDCQECPLNLKCVACLAGLTASLPVKVLKEKRKIDLKTLLILTDSTHYVLRKRPKKGLLAGLWEFPMVEGHRDLSTILTDFENSGYRTIEALALPDSKHVFTHREWLIKAFLVKTEFPQAAQAGFVHATLAELKQHYALSSLFDIYLEKLT
jgi:A/G-specific adenine glycosylase